MRFKSQITNVGTFAKFCASLASLGQIAWCRLSEDDVRFTVIPEKGSQVWSVLRIETVFDNYTVESKSPNNIIDLEVPIQALQRALSSALGATSASIRLTKKNNVPLLSLTIITNTFSSGNGVVSLGSPQKPSSGARYDLDNESDDIDFVGATRGGPPRERETIITQDIPVKVLAMNLVEGLHEPQTQEPDVHIYLPNLSQVKSISERFTRLALASKAGFGGSGSGPAPRLELSANMHGSLKIAIRTDALAISSVWTGLAHPDLDPTHFPEGSQIVREHPSERMRLLAGPDGENEAGWSKVRIDGKDWSKVLSVGRLGVRVIACFINEAGLILYVYLPSEEVGGEESCLTYYISSFSA